MNNHHKDILDRIKKGAGKPTQHTFLDNYLGNVNPRYALSTPALRKIAKEWLKDNPELDSSAFEALLTHLISGKSSTEKCMAGILLGYATADQRQFNPVKFDLWLDHLTGWAEVDAVCTGSYTEAEIPSNIRSWEKLLVRFSKSENIHKRRASLVLLCSPLRCASSPSLAKIALANVDRLKHEKEILITKAISWLLRSMIKYHKGVVSQYVHRNKKSLPAIAVRETVTKLKTGRKTG